MTDRREEVYRSIRRKLLEGVFHSRRDLSRHRLAAALKASPSNVQWALTRLEAEKVLEIRPQAGTCVRRLDREEFRRLYELRELLEPYAAARAARFITEAQLARLKRNCRETAELYDGLARCEPDRWPPGYIERDVRLENTFHGTILEAAQHPEIAHLMENLVIPLIEFEYGRIKHWPHPALVAIFRSTLADHRGLLEAMGRRDARQARLLMRRHLRLLRGLRKRRDGS
jgi:DNA-binding GntR family transcriptional regulator